MSARQCRALGGALERPVSGGAGGPPGRPPHTGRAPSVIMSRDEVAQLLRSARLDPRDFALLTMLYETAMRRSEAARLRLGGIDLGRGVIRFERPKNDDVHEVPLLARSAAALRVWLRARYGARTVYPPGDLVFPGRRGRPLAGSSLWRVVRKYGSMAGIPAPKLHPHCLRASRATHLLEDGVAQHWVMRLLGHTDPRSTEHYLKTCIEGLRGALE